MSPTYSQMWNPIPWRVTEAKWAGDQILGKGARGFGEGFLFLAFSFQVWLPGMADMERIFVLLVLLNF